MCLQIRQQGWLQPIEDRGTCLEILMAYEERLLQGEKAYVAKQVARTSSKFRRARYAVW